MEIKSNKIGYKPFVIPFGKIKGQHILIQEQMYEGFIEEFDQLYVAASLLDYQFDSRIDGAAVSLLFYGGERKRFIFEFKVNVVSHLFLMCRIFKYDTSALNEYEYYNNYGVDDLVKSFKEFKEIFAEIG